MTSTPFARMTHEMKVRILSRTLEQRMPRPGKPFPCPYLPGQQARHVNIMLSPTSPGLYHSLMDLGFRRLGPIFYRPQCDSCHECRILRIPVAEFRPRRSQKRCWAHNRDVAVEPGTPQVTEEKRHLYRRYLERRHDGQMDGSAEELGFLCSSSIETIEIRYRLAGELVGVGLADVEPLAMSAVYSYFHPSLSGRSLGVFNILWMIEECRRRGKAHLYLGYYVRDCPKMSYKADYRPCEILGSDGRWMRGA